LSDAEPLRQRALATLTRLPPFSPILSRLMDSLAGEEVSFLVLGELIEKDTVIAANILRMVNSAIYARRGAVSSVRHALAVLGVERVRNTVLALSISRMLHSVKTPPGWSMERFNRHGAAAAILSDLLASRLRAEYPEGAFVAGLLHDMGRLLIAMALPDRHQMVAAHHRETGRSWFECEREILGFDHAGLSAAALEQWNLPQPIRDAVGDHHAARPAPPGEPVPLALVLQTADAYVNSLGHSILPAAPGPDRELGVFAPLPLEPDALSSLTARFHAEWSAVAHYYQ
jgi:HD-like signal output (HDOD) protein